MNKNNLEHIGEPFVSVVTPFYNAEQYLSECIESVLNQNYNNFEYVLVDNCSSDRSLEIARNFGSMDPRIRVVKNEIFLQQVQNYNHALKQISEQSKYCKIVQADDWIFPDCIREMVSVAESEPAVGIVGAYRLDDCRVNCDGLPYPDTIFSGRDICRKSLLEDFFVFGSATSILLRSDIVRSRSPFYEENCPHEDTESCYEILYENNFGFVHKVLTFTRRENESLTSRIRKFDPFYLVDKLTTIVKFGRLYLDGPEYIKCLENVEYKYYQFLGTYFLTSSWRDYYDYHSNNLKSIDYKINSFKLMKYRIIYLLKSMFNIRSLILKLK